MQHVHFLGIGGSGASAIAAIAQAQGFTVTGCDKSPNNEFTQEFSDSQLLTGHSPDHLQGVDILAITPAITSLDPTNAELTTAKEKGIEVLTWQEFMGKYLEKNQFVIAICGTHGKSTTTAMVGQLLEDTNLDPTVELGAIVPKWGKNYRVGHGEYFVTEADEFNNNFLASTPDITIVTSIEMDHPEFFKDFASYKESFDRFLSKTKQTIIANLENEGVAEVMKGVLKHSTAQAVDYSKSEFTAQLKVAGRHNFSNAKAVFQLGLLLNIEPLLIIKSLENFTGLGRRFEHIGLYQGAEVYSDFGHHPAEIKATIEAAKDKFPHKRIFMVFQPHMFSRTKFLFDDFVKVFRTLPTEKIFLIDIYPSREVDTGMVKSEQLATSTNRENVVYQSGEELKESLHREIKEGDILIFMGAGDIDQIARKLAQ